MELGELKTLWQQQDTKLERALKLNLRCLEMIQAQKVKSKLAPLMWQRIVEVILQVIVLIWLIGFLLKNLNQWPYAVSAIILIAFYSFVLLNCVKQIIIIKQMDFSDNIINIQSSLVLLQIRIVDYARLTFLVFPTWLAYPLIAFRALTNVDILSKLNGNWWISQVIFSLVLLPVCIWLYTQVSYKNIHKQWVKFIIGQLAGTRVLKAMQFIKELETLKQ